MAANDRTMSEIDSPLGTIHILDYCCQPISAFWNTIDLCAPWWRFYYNYEAGGSVAIDGATTELTPDKVYLIPPFTHMTASCRGNPLQFFIHFGTWRNLTLPPQGIYQFPYSEDFRTMIRACFSDAPGRERSPDRSLGCLDIAVRALRQLRVAYPQAHHDRSAIDPRLEEALQILWDSLGKDLSGAELAERFGMSADGFIRLFKRGIGLSPMAYQKRQRLYGAAQQLLSTDLPIDLIAEQSGYQDRFAFSKAFKGQFGIPPKAFKTQAGA
jgi:AraC-like DNA-binding protein